MPVLNYLNQIITTMKKISKLDKVLNPNFLNNGFIYKLDIDSNTTQIVDSENISEIELENENSKAFNLLDEEIQENLNFEIWANELNMPVEKLNIAVCFDSDDNYTPSDYCYVKVNNINTGYLAISVFYNENKKQIEFLFDFQEE